MKVTLFGTRGSTPVAGPDYVRYGGNTTCVRIESDCIPEDWAFVLDSGSGFVPLSKSLLQEKVMNVGVAFTHYHHDHTQGLLLAPHTFIPTARMMLWGPKEHGEGPAEVIDSLMRPPYFPVSFKKVRHRIKATPFDEIGTQVLVVHPSAGFHLLDIHQYRRRLSEGKELHLGGTHHSVGECLVVQMYKTVHPEYTVSYRLEEKPTGKVFVFLTDHENTAEIPRDLLAHVRGADLLVQDGQYSKARYVETAGFGHGTPEYCTEMMIRTEAKRLGITHHDPFATDAEIDMRVKEARTHAVERGVTNAEERIFGCSDHQELVV